MEGSDALVAAARAVRRHARADYSGFAVGAALLTADGATYVGANVESASYGLTICAERVALATAISDGARRFTALAVVANTGAPTPPCGACRQLLWEYGGNLNVILANLTTVTGEHTLAELLPHPFDRRLL